jgi:lipoate-protein ligase A
MKNAFEKVLNIQFVEQDLTPLENSIKTKLLNNKYLCDQWNMEGEFIPFLC